MILNDVCLICGDVFETVWMLGLKVVGEVACVFHFRYVYVYSQQLHNTPPTIVEDISSTSLHQGSDNLEPHF